MPAPMQNRGFTLVEMAVVLFVIGLLMSGLLGGLSLQQESRRLAETRDALEQAREALLGYALTHNRLPCPADGSLAQTHPAAGRELAARTAQGRCQTLQGVLPWADLGLRQTDGWGRRFTYRVSAAFTECQGPAVAPPGDPPVLPTGCQTAITACGVSGTRPCFTLATTPDLRVYRSAPAACPTPPATPPTGNVANNVPAIIVSHGRQFHGSFGPEGGAPAPGASGDAAENSDDNRCFVSRSDGANGYDDETFWLSPAILFSRLVGASRLP
ncbi:prepilin-type N-terminal cleavage/methylation domain-containing protein [Formivibrio citricus]|uniref:Prepilin-type N-terminal cleavage/methylation domain-containing protein n=1 Tax=Formivibrio citricus TaxID=83765 RepID=A0A1I5DDJ3_9NEIS|nr:type II secretion system protein [Formivibrio citricus]SFN97319.1 prepilin-type N-terminal cleavage/methylation domain-containing protein [Formivibrio citricus]